MDLATPLNESPPPQSVRDQGLEDDRTEATARGVFRGILGAALIAVSVASVLNWLWLTQYAPVPHTARAVLRTGPPTRMASTLPVAKSGSALKKIPPTVLQYETIARHQVPGATRATAEAIYKSLNMDVEIQVPISVYVSVEEFASSTAAHERATEIMKQFPVMQEPSVVASITPATVGFTENEGARAIVWVRDNYVTLVKTMFLNSVPAERRDFLKNLGTPVARSTDVYQRTGKSGVEAGGN